MNATAKKIDIPAMIRYGAERPVRQDIAKTGQIMSQFACFEPGQDGILHHHPTQDEIFFVIEGRGAMTVGDDEIPVEAHSAVFVPAGVPHRARANRESRLVIMFTKCTSAAAKAA